MGTISPQTHYRSVVTTGWLPHIEATCHGGIGNASRQAASVQPERGPGNTVIMRSGHTWREWHRPLVQYCLLPH